MEIKTNTAGNRCGGGEIREVFFVIQWITVELCGA